jgi:hypothetical protein
VVAQNNTNLYNLKWSHYIFVSAVIIVDAEEEEEELLDIVDPEEV